MSRRGAPTPPRGGWSREPIRFDVRRLLRTGGVLVGEHELRTGMSREQVRAVVPEPTAWVPTGSGRESDCWAWGAVELLFGVDDTVRLYCDRLDGLSDSGPGVIADPWFLRQGLPADRLSDELTSAGIVHQLWRADDGPRGLAHLPAADVWLHLEPAADGPDALVLEAVVSGGDPRRGAHWSAVERLT